MSRGASATFVRGMTLEELVHRSQHAVVGTPLSAQCRYLTIGGRPMLVTETQVRVESPLGLPPPSEGVLTMRTLGGQLNGVGELVHGQAELRVGQLCAAFFERAPDGAGWLTGMAQGHYPLERAGAAHVLRPSPQLPTIRDWDRSAVKRLVGTRLSEAEQLVARASGR
ncbi:MAG TPA: hypothetical protein VFK05_01035 [Polyangiaceae bacterium]|nr:hypothetical protein [Polyangiaceae bacterium]